jgi:hydrogenase maturation protein HypF
MDLANSFFRDRTDQISLISQAIEKKINSPYTSSCGRLFDAIAAILGIRDTVAYEGQAAIMLEALAIKATQDIPDIGEFKLINNDDQYLIDPNEILHNIVTYNKDEKNISGISRAFHEALIEVFTQLASLIRSETGIERVALSGGCFQNMFLLRGLMQRLKKNKFQVLTNAEVPVNDGGIALGQAYWGMHNT